MPHRHAGSHHARPDDSVGRARPDDPVGRARLPKLSSGGASVGRFTDIVGYTALMGEDEEKALHIRRINHQIHRQKIEAVGGTWLKEMGDGTL